MAATGSRGDSVARADSSYSSSPTPGVHPPDPPASQPGGAAFVLATEDDVDLVHGLYWAVVTMSTVGYGSGK